MAYEFSFPWDNPLSRKRPGYVGYRTRDGVFIADEQTYYRYESYLEDRIFQFKCVIAHYIGNYTTTTWRGKEVYQLYQITDRQVYDNIINYIGFRFFFEQNQSWRSTLPCPPYRFPVKIAITIGDGKYMGVVNASDLMYAGENDGLYDKMALSDSVAKAYLRGR